MSIMETNKSKRVVFFCSANRDIDPKYDQAAQEVVRAACLRGYVILSGGAAKGTMETVARTAQECGGYHIGVLPRFMEQFRYPGLSEVIWTETMAERKEKMREDTSFAIALPGGIGTLDELVETHVLSKLGKYDGKILALNLDGFYEPLKTLLGHYVAMGMATAEDMDRIKFVDTVDEIIAEIN